LLGVRRTRFRARNDDIGIVIDNQPPFSSALRMEFSFRVNAAASTIPPTTPKDGAHEWKDPGEHDD
jgi:hypothetical protein